MNRYKKANEGVHAPEELKEKTARPGGRRPQAPWIGAVAAMLAVALIGGIVMWPGSSTGPGVAALYNNGPGVDAPTGVEGPGESPGQQRSTPENGAVGADGSVGAGDASRSYEACALALAAYPSMPPFPKDEEFVSQSTGVLDYDSWDKAYTAWRSSKTALRSQPGFYPDGFMDGFLKASVAELLTGAGEENRVYSPLNVYMALSMLAETTGGDSRQQILDLLQVDSIEILRDRAAALWKDHYRDDGAVTSILANSLWLSDALTYNQDTLDILAGDYYASAFSGKMGTEEYNQALRDWINQQTGGLLAQQANGLEMSPETVLALASTIYFKAAWDDGFSEDRTETDTFHAPGGDVDTDFMHSSSQGTFYWGDNFTAIALSFQEGGRMWLVLPAEGYSVDELLDSGEAMDFLLADKQDTYGDDGQVVVEGWTGQKHLTINLSMPRFDVSSDLSLIEGLQKLGVTDVFDFSAANFDPLGAGTDDPLYVSSAQHAARVKVDEEGCEAAAYTVMMIECAAAFMPPEDEVDFILDRPFLFAIQSDWTGLPLFVGAVNQPNG